MMHGITIGVLIFSLIFCFVQFISHYRKEHYKNGVIVRVARPSISQQKRYLKWMKSLSKKYFFWIITDCKTKLLSNFTNVFRISSQDIKNKYPSIQTLRKPGHCRFKEASDDFFYPYMSHTENIIAWKDEYKIKFKYLWIIEQDFGCTGKISDFFEIYDLKYYDFITSGINLFTKEEWPHINCCSDNYFKWREKYSNNSVGYTSSEFIQRWSYNLTMILEKNLKNGIHAVSEASVTETVIFNNLTYKIIDKKYIGNRFGWNRRISKRRWEVILNTTTDIKFYHALKF